MTVVLIHVIGKVPQTVEIRQLLAADGNQRPGRLSFKSKGKGGLPTPGAPSACFKMGGSEHFYETWKGVGNQ